MMRWAWIQMPHRAFDSSMKTISQSTETALEPRKKGADFVHLKRLQGTNHSWCLPDTEDPSLFMGNHPPTAGCSLVQLSNSLAHTNDRLK